MTEGEFMAQKIETTRLIIRPYLHEDLEDVYGQFSNTEATKYFQGGTKTHEETKKYLIDAIHAFETPSPMGRRAVVLKETKKVIGYVGLCYLKEALQNFCGLHCTDDALKNKIELSYGLNRKYWGKGYAFEAAKAMLDYGFNTIGLKEIVAAINPKNMASIKIAKKLGMKYEREIDWPNQGKVNLFTVQSKCKINDECFDQNFERFDLSGKMICSKIFENCKFDQCNFSETDFQKCRFCDCEFEHCNLSIIKIKGCSFSNVKFVDSKIAGVNWTEGAWPKIKLLCPIHFTKCDISHSTFFGMNLREVSIIECRANNVDFREADLTKANLTYSDFAESLFINSNLTEADFSYAENYRVDVTTNKTTKAKFMLPEAIALLYGLDIELVDSN
jgi:RimJ/RimL family protein N-acetyltransferase